MRHAIGVALAVGASLPSIASAQIRAGAEFGVNAYTTGRQAFASVAADRSGGFLATWESAGPDGSGLGVRARRYDAASSTPMGPEFAVNGFTTGDQSRPAVAATGLRGGFVVVWQSAGQDGSLGGIVGRRFDPTGTAVGVEFVVNTTTAGDQSDPSVASDPLGNFVVTWTSDGQDGSGRGVFAQRFAASGARRGAELRANTYTPGDQNESAVAMDAAGNFVVTWTSADGTLQGIFAQRFDAAGAPRGGEFRVNASTDGSQEHPRIASGGGGDFVIVWAECQYFSPMPPFFRNVVEGRRFDASGAPVGSDLNVNTTPMRASCPAQIPTASPSVASDAIGDFVVIWDEATAGIVGQRFDVTGVRRGIEFQANTFAGAVPRSPAIASDESGNLIAAWDNAVQEGSAEGIFGQRYGGLVPWILEVDSTPSGSDGNQVLEPGESVDVRPSWRNSNGATLVFDGATLAFGGLPAPGVSYQLVDGAGSYGSVPDDAIATCSDCYEVAVGFGGTRPGVHWDAAIVERLVPDYHGQTKPWLLHVGASFSDVPRTSPYYRFVEMLLHGGVTGGCANGLYCPGAETSREQMAALVLLGREGPGYAPAPCGSPGAFADVPATSPFCDVIEELARRGVVGGCGGGNYCPTSPVTREQVAVFVLRTLDPALSPPACAAPMFADVPASSPFCPWIEELARRGIVTGCGGGNYCPVAPVTREQMAVFIAATFTLVLYGP